MKKSKEKQPNENKAGGTANRGEEAGMKKKQKWKAEKEEEEEQGKRIQEGEDRNQTRENPRIEMQRKKMQKRQMLYLKGERRGRQTWNAC